MPELRTSVADTLLDPMSYSLAVLLLGAVVVVPTILMPMLWTRDDPVRFRRKRVRGSMAVAALFVLFAALYTVAAEIEKLPVDPTLREFDASA